MVVERFDCGHPRHPPHRRPPAAALVVEPGSPTVAFPRCWACLDQLLSGRVGLLIYYFPDQQRPPDHHATDHHGRGVDHGGDPTTDQRP